MSVEVQFNIEEEKLEEAKKKLPEHGGVVMREYIPGMKVATVKSQGRAFGAAGKRVRSIRVAFPLLENALSFKKALETMLGAEKYVEIAKL